MGLVAVGGVSLLDVALRRYHTQEGACVTAPAAVNPRGRRQALRRGHGRGEGSGTDIDLDGRGGRVRVADRPVGLRQVDAAADRRRTSSSRATGTVHGQRQAARPARAWTRTTASPSSRRGSSRGGRWEGNVSLPLELHGVRRAKRRAQALELLELVGPARLRRAPPEPALGRDAAAGGDRPRPPRRPGGAADGRALRRARRDDARADADRAAPDLARDRARRSSSSPTRSTRRCSSPTGWW